MTILTVLQDISTVIGVAVPAAVFTSTVREHQELAALANEVAERIQGAYDWQRVKRLVTYTGDGTTTAFDLPSDYSRMAAGQNVYTSARIGPMRQVQDHDEWLDLTLRAQIDPRGAWTLLGGQMNFLTAPAADELVKYYYISTLYARSSGTETTDFFPLDFPFEFPDSETGGTRKAKFDDDDDGFQLDERLLKLGITWQYKANKGLPYAEDMVNYELRLQDCIARDPGQRGGHIGRKTFHRDVKIAYPWALG
jgi:hypothetical protein